MSRSPAPQRDGGTRCAAGGDERSERRDNHDDGHADADTGQGEAAVAGHMSDIDAVYDVIEHVDELGNGRSAQPAASAACRPALYPERIDRYS